MAYNEVFFLPPEEEEIFNSAKEACSIQDLLIQEEAAISRTILFVMLMENA